jgi:hypothetical protein
VSDEIGRVGYVGWGARAPASATKARTRTANSSGHSICGVTDSGEQMRLRVRKERTGYRVRQDELLLGCTVSADSLDVQVALTRLPALH